MIVFRSQIFSPLPSDDFESPRFVHLEDGFLAVDEDGRISAVGEWHSLPADFAREQAIDFGRTSLITPGFVDTHLHAPQLEMIGSYGGHLLEWLHRYTFPTEAKFRDPAHARDVARVLFRELLRNGTLTALVFSTVHRQATEIFFEEAEALRFRGIIGKAMMDRHAPEELLEDARTSYDESRQLLQRWHDRGKLRYAITPRFAPTSSPELLEAAGTLKREFPSAYVHTHISENLSELEWVRELFPGDGNYASIYDRFGLLGERTVLAHGVHLSGEELDLIAERGSRISHCPNSNLFLGSGLFPMDEMRRHHVTIGLGSDIGAGTTPSMLNAMADAYKVQQVRGFSLSPVTLWYLATLGGAKTLSLDDVTGSLEARKDADFLVLNLEATPLLKMRLQHARDLNDLLAGLIFIGDDRAIARRYIAGVEVQLQE